MYLIFEIFGRKKRELLPSGVLCWPGNGPGLPSHNDDFRYVERWRINRRADPDRGSSDKEVPIDVAVDRDQRTAIARQFNAGVVSCVFERFEQRHTVLGRRRRCYQTY